MASAEHPDEAATPRAALGSLGEERAANDERAAPREFFITRGGPFDRLLRRLHVIGPTGAPRVWWLVVFTWFPLPLGATLRALVGVPQDPIFLDISVHVRFLVALPLVVLAERLFGPQVRAAVLLLHDFAERAALDRVIDRAERLRDRAWVEGVLAVIAVASGQLVYWGATGPTGVFHGVEQAAMTFSRIWYAVIALPLLNFLALRWLWRWVIWTYVLVRVSRLPLAAAATHPDGAAGLRFLSGPVTGFAAFELAFAVVLAAAWGTQLIDGRVTVPSLLPTLVAFLVLAVVVACGPLLLFTPHLYRAQRQALLSYGPFALGYVRRFHRKWIDRRTDEQVLGTPDLQSLADLGTAYQAIQSTGMLVFSTRKIVELWLAAIVPMVPLVATVVPVEQLFRRLGSTLFGGLL